MRASTLIYFALSCSSSTLADPSGQPQQPLQDPIEPTEPTHIQPGHDLVTSALETLRSLPTAGPPRSTSLWHNHLTNFLYSALPTLQLSAPNPSSASTSSSSSSSSSSTTSSSPLSQATQFLQEAATLNNTDALYLLADLHFYGKYAHPRNLTTAFRYYDQLATLSGNATAQFMLGVYYGTGLANVVPADQAKALLYYTFAALQHDVRAEMALGYRHHAGIGTPKNCEIASKHYRHTAERAIAWYRSGPPGGRSWITEAWRMADEVGGVYGEGASVASSGMNSLRAGVSSDQNAAMDDVIEYLDLLSQKSDSKASYNLGRIYYEGQRGLDRDLDLARKYFSTVVRRHWRKDGRVAENPQPETERYAAKSAGFLGRMYLRGEGVPQDFGKARAWFHRGVQHGDAQCQHGLGILFLHGYGMPANVALATEYLKAAAEQDYAPAQLELGILYLDQGGPDSIKMANNYFELAARYGNLDAYYYLAELTYHGVGRDRTCHTATHHYKGVTERVEPLVSSWAEANRAYEQGHWETAFLHYLILAEQGYERAQNNVAWLLDSPPGLSIWSSLPLSLSWSSSSSSPSSPSSPSPSSSLLSSSLQSLLHLLHPISKPDPPFHLGTSWLALVYWTRSSKQGNVDSLVKMGDYYFYGIGTDPDLTKAVQCYSGASDYSQSAQALWNLGWMHENGLGLKQDYHLAKRFYDQALAVNAEAYLPVTLSLLKLRIRSAWNTLTHGPIHSIQEDPKPKKNWSWREWIDNFVQDDLRYYERNVDEADLLDPLDGQSHGQNHGLGQNHDGLANHDGLGQRHGQGQGQGHDQRPSQGQERGSRHFQGEYEDDEDTDLDGILILGVVTVLIFLVYYRQVRQQRAEEAVLNHHRGQARQRAGARAGPRAGRRPGQGLASPGQGPTGQGQEGQDQEEERGRRRDPVDHQPQPQPRPEVRDQRQGQDPDHRRQNDMEDREQVPHPLADHHNPLYQNWGH